MPRHDGAAAFVVYWAVWVRECIGCSLSIAHGQATKGSGALGYELSLLRRSRDGLQPSCASNRVVASSQRECIHVTKTKSVDMAPGAQLSSAMSIDMAPGRSRVFLRQRIGVFYVVVACPLTCHSRRSRVFAAKNRCLLCSGGMSIDVPLAAQPRLSIVTMNSPSCGGRGMAFSHPAPQTAL